VKRSKWLRWLLRRYAARFIVAGLFVGVAFVLLFEHGGPRQMLLSDVLARAGLHQVTQAQINSRGSDVTVTVTNGQQFTANYPSGYEGQLTARLLSDGVKVKAVSAGFWSKWGSLVEWVGFTIAIVFMPFMSSWIRTRSAVRKTQVTDIPAERFDDVKGASEIIDELRQLVDFLRHPARYTKAGVQIPRGWLFSGAPGTGKTLTARAVAGEAGCPFFYISGSEFAAQYIGEGAARVRALFDRARNATFEGWSIVFIDEVDAIGGTRSDDDGGSHEYSVTLNELLTQMDGFLRTGSKVIVIAATNRPETLDPALLRAGRLTRQIAMPEPDVAARQEMLRKYASALTMLDPAVDFETLARITTGSSGSDLAALCNAAGLLALRKDADTVTTEHFTEALAIAVMGHPRTSVAVADEDRTISAAHEAGHALAAFLLPKASKPHQVTIIPRGHTGGLTWTLGTDRLHLTAETARQHMTVAMAGRAAEKLLFGENGFAAGGAAEDTNKASDLALHAVCEWGMGSLTAHVDVRDWQDDPRADKIAEEVDELVRDAERRASTLLRDNRVALDALIAKLLAVETVSGEDVAQLVSGETPPAVSTS
jgi:cell division protease FtsH